MAENRSMIYVFVMWETRGSEDSRSDVMAFNASYNYRKQFEQAMARAAKASGYGKDVKVRDVLTITDFRPIPSPATMISGG